MFQRLLHKQARIWAVLAGAVATVTVLAGTVQMSDRTELNREAATATERVEWYQQIADPNTAPGVDGLLARDLQPYLHDPEGLAAFRGSSNRYGGITDAIGFDPFNGVGCEECGPLDPDVQDAILAIGNGGLNDLVSTTVVHVDDSSYTLTPWGWPWSVTIIFYWIIIGMFALAVGAILVDEEDLSLYPWGTRSKERTLVTVLSPVPAVMFRTARRMNRRAFERKVRTKFPEQVALLERVDGFLERLPTRDGDPIVAPLVHARSMVVAELEAQTRGRGRTSNDDLKELTRQLEDTAEVLRVRAEAIGYVDG